MVTVKYTKQNKHFNTHISFLIQLFFSHKVCRSPNSRGLPWACCFTALFHREPRLLCVTIFSSHVYVYICGLCLCLKVSNQPEEISKNHFQLFWGQCLIGVHPLRLVLSGQSWDWHILMASVSSVPCARFYTVWTKACQCPLPSSLHGSFNSLHYTLLTLTEMWYLHDS